MPRKRKRVIRNRVQWIANFPRADLRRALFQALLLFLCCARWEPWGDCSTSCGVGQRFRTRVGDAQSEVSNRGRGRGRFLLCPTQVKSAELYGGQLGHLRIQVQLQITRTSTIINDV